MASLACSFPKLCSGAPFQRALNHMARRLNPWRLNDSQDSGSIPHISYLTNFALGYITIFIIWSSSTRHLKSISLSYPSWRFNSDPKWAWTRDFPWTFLPAFGEFMTVGFWCLSCLLLAFPFAGCEWHTVAKATWGYDGLVALLWMVKFLLGCSMGGSRNTYILLVFVYALPNFQKILPGLQLRHCIKACFPSPSAEASSLEATMKKLISKHSPTPWVRSCPDIVMLKQRDTTTLTCHTPWSKLPSLVSSQAFPV